MAATYYREVVSMLVVIVGDGYHLHWPHRGDWASTAAGARARTNVRACMIADLQVGLGV